MGDAVADVEGLFGFFGVFAYGAGTHGAGEGAGEAVAEFAEGDAEAVDNLGGG